MLLCHAVEGGYRSPGAPRFYPSLRVLEHVLVPLQHEPDRDGDRAPELPADHADLDPAVVG
jgi:hypothetical protein